MALEYPDTTIWFVQASTGHGPINEGSAVAVRLQKRGDPLTAQTYLLTCAHVVRERSPSGIEGYGEALPRIRVWPSGVGFNDREGRTADIALDINHPLSTDPHNAADDWVLLRIHEPQAASAAPTVRDWSTASQSKKGFHVDGYMGEGSFRESVVIPTQSPDAFQFHSEFHGDLRLTGDGARPGMSGGCVFTGATPQFVGIHRARYDDGLELHVVSASHIKEQLFQRGYEPAIQPDPIPVPNKDFGKSSTDPKAPPRISPIPETRCSIARSSIERLQAVAGGLSAASAVLLAWPTNHQSIEGLLASLHLPSALWLTPVMSGVLLLFGISLLWQGLSPKSRLLWPEALLIDPDNPDHLRGRTDEIRRLSQAVMTHPLVFLEGESGSGKSALVRSGLIPALRNPPGESLDPSVFPIYLNSYPDDWEDGLYERLVNAVWRQLGVELRQRFAISERSGLQSRLLPANSPSLFKRIREELGLIPLIIFDQFDDYQVANRRQFLRDGQWITTAELSEANWIWRRIGEELKHHALHLLFVTRRELSGGLEAVRLATPNSRFLDRLEPAVITALLEQLVTPKADGRRVICNPTAGWESLKNRITKDLSFQGRVLPIQARVVFKGLSDLSSLSIDSYEDRGGLEGLEAAYIEDGMGAAARSAGIPNVRALGLLLPLVDDSDPDAPKTRSVTIGDLVRSTNVDIPQINRALGVLEEKGIIRRGAGEGSEQQTVWSLYHDYLARGVLAAHRRANRWQRLLTDRLRALREAGGWRSWWYALLSPWEQLRLILPTLTGKIRWSSYRGLALLSMVRFLPMIVALGLVWFGIEQGLNWQARQDTNRILSVIRGGTGKSLPDGEEYRQLWTLAAGSSRLKRTFVERSIQDGGSHDALLRHIEAIGQSLLGLDADRGLRTELLDRILAHRPLTSYSATFTTLILRSLAASVPKQTVLIAADAMMRTMSTMKRPSLSILGQALGGLGERLPAEQAAAVARRLVEAMTTYICKRLR